MKISDKIIYVLIAAIFAGFSCKKEEVDFDKISNTVNWDPKLAVPIGYGNYSFKDLIESQDSTGLIKEDVNNLLYLTYRTELLSEIAENLITLEDQSYPYSISANIPGFPSFGALPTINYAVTVNDTLAFTNNEEIDSVYFKAGTLNINVSSTFHNTGTIKIIFPTLKLNGVAKQIDIPITSNTGNFTYTVPSEDLAGYRLYFNKSGSVSNIVPYTFDITLNSSATPVSSTDKITFNLQLQQLKFKYLFGYFPQIDNLFSYSDKIELDLFNVDNSTTIDFNNPKVNLYFSNSFGVPVQFDLSNIRTYSDNTGYYNILLNPSGKIVKYPDLTEIGQTKLDTLQYTKANSNIISALQTAPKYFYYTLNTTPNPISLGKPYNFIADNSTFGADLEIELPLDMRTKKFEVIDTLDFDLGGAVNDFSIIKRLALHCNFENGMPFSLNCQMFLTDNNYLPIDSVFKADQQPIIPSGIVDATGKVTQASSKPLIIEFTGTRIENFKNVKKAILHIKLNTSDSNGAYPYVKFYSTDKLKVGFGIETDLEVHSLDQF